MESLYYVLTGLSVLIMVYAWVKITRLRKKLPGGIMKSTGNVLGELVGLFTVGYIALPLFPMLPQISRDILVAVMFLFAAIFAVIVINLFSMIASDLGF